MSNQLALPAAFKAMETDIQISMDDVVSAFVSQYEDNLYTRKKKLTTAIKTIEAQITDLTDAVCKEITGDSFKEPMPYGLVITISEGSPSWEDKQVNFSIKIVPPQDGSHHYRNSIEFTKNKPIPKAALKSYKAWEKELKALRDDFTEVLVSLKSVARKERQVRGRIAVRKLEDSGYASLMQDSELVKLVQLDG